MERQGDALTATTRGAHALGQRGFSKLAIGGVIGLLALGVVILGLQRGGPAPSAQSPGNDAGTPVSDSASSPVWPATAHEAILSQVAQLDFLVSLRDDQFPAVIAIFTQEVRTVESLREQAPAPASEQRSPAATKQMAAAMFRAWKRARGLLTSDQCVKFDAKKERGVFDDAAARRNVQMMLTASLNIVAVVGTPVVLKFDRHKTVYVTTPDDLRSPKEMFDQKYGDTRLGSIGFPMFSSLIIVRDEKGHFQSARGECHCDVSGNQGSEFLTVYWEKPSTASAYRIVRVENSYGRVIPL
jgi:hypothetical protein